MRTSLYTPYGAFEMKATYQRNLMLGTVTVTAMIALVLLIAALYPESATVIIDPGEQVLDSVSVWFRLPPPIERSSGNGGAAELPQDVVPYAVPIPAPDERFMEEESPLIASQSELAVLGLPFASGGEGIGAEGGNGGFVVDTSRDDWPGSHDFIKVEVLPEMIKQYHEAYPRVIREMGLTGKVTVRVLIDEEGKVLTSELARSSGVATLDEVAVRWAKKCIFSPGIQNGRPVKIWVTFTYEFVLDQ